MTTERDDLSPAAIMARHAPMTDGPFVGWCAACPTSQRKRPCEPYRLAQALSQAQSELERIASHTRDAYDQRDAAQEALAASEAKVARLGAQRDEARERAVMLRSIVDKTGEALGWLPYDDCLIDYDDDPTRAAPCPRETPFKSYTEPTCSRPKGHAGGCLFNSHDGRTPLEVMPGAKPKPDPYQRSADA